MAEAPPPPPPPPPPSDVPVQAVGDEFEFESSLAGLKVAEHLRALSVAGEGACPSPSRVLEEGEEGGASGAPEGGSAALREGDAGGPLPLADPPGLAAGDDAAAGPEDEAMEQEPPPLGDDGGSSCQGWTSPPVLNSGPGERGEGGGGPVPESREGPLVEDLPPPPSGGFNRDDSTIMGSDGDRAGGDPPGDDSASQGEESQRVLPEASPAAPERETEGPPAVGSRPSSTAASESDSESDTDTDSSSSVSSPSSCLPSLSEDDEEKCKDKKNSFSTKKKDESTEKKLPDIEEVTIILPETVALLPFGKISSIIEDQVIIESEKGLPAVNEDTVFFKGDRHSIGKVFEVFGPVSHPFYVLQFNSAEHIESKGIKVHDAVYFAPSVESFTQYIFPEALQQDKGSDASWKNDEEAPPEALDFSDDEKEKAAKQEKKSQNIRRRKFKQDYNENGMNCQPRQQHPSDYFGGYCRGEPNPRFSRRRFPQSSVPPRFFRQPGRTPQYYLDYTESNKPPGFYQQQRQDNFWRHQYSFPPPSFETANNEANFPPPPPPVNWGWPLECSQNVYDPLLSLLSLPPPPPPPLPPPSVATSSNSMNPP